MKLRIRDNSIRLRLSKTEVDIIRSDGIVGGKTAFAAGSILTYCVESSPACVDPAAHFANGELLVRLPESMVVAWAGTDDVSMAARQSLEDGSYLDILVEKDFACLTPREGEDESDLFPHPEEGQARC